MKKMLNYETLGNALKAMSDACFKAAEQQKNGEPVTACGMSDDDLDNLCEQIPFMLNPYMTAGQVKKEAHISESTLRRAIADGELGSWRAWGTLGTILISSRNGMLESLSRKD